MRYTKRERNTTREREKSKKYRLKQTSKYKDRVRETAKETHGIRQKERERQR